MSNSGERRKEKENNRKKKISKRGERKVTNAGHWKRRVTKASEGWWKRENTIGKWAGTEDGITVSKGKIRFWKRRTKTGCGKYKEVSFTLWKAFRDSGAVCG